MHTSPHTLGVIMLDTRFPRPVGDIGRRETFAFPVLHQAVEGAVPAAVVRSAGSFHSSGIAGRFVQAARELVRRGATAITTSCGFLVLMQKQLQAAVDVPVVTSSLLSLPLLLAREPRVGVLTIDAGSLSQDHLMAAGVDASRLQDVIVGGVAAGTEFRRAILGNDEHMDIAQAHQDVLHAAIALHERAPEISTMVLECTNMPPCAAAIEAATGVATVTLLQSARLMAGSPFHGCAAAEQCISY